MWCNSHSYFSLRYGIIKPTELVEWLLHTEQPSPSNTIHFCLTDINNVSGIPDFFREAQKHKGLHPCAGIDFRNGAQSLYIGIARNEDGFAELNRFLSQYQMAHEPLPPIPPAFENAFVIYPLEYAVQASFRHTLRHNEYIGVRPEQLTKLRFSAFKDQMAKCVALCTATFQSDKDYNCHRLLRCIENNCLLSKLPPTETGASAHLYRSSREILELYADAPELVMNAQKLLAQCEFSVEFHTPKNKRSYLGDIQQDYLKMDALAREGLHHRYKNPNEVTFQRLDKELKVIREFGFTSYFLINWDITQFAKRKGFFYVGRGSGANSLVAYCLGITDVDPMELDLYFERFINPNRSSPPDFDLDFSWRDREEITRHIFNTHGKDHTALLGTYNSFQESSVIRELGKVFGLPKEEINQLVNNSEQYYSNHLEGGKREMVKSIRSEYAKAYKAAANANTATTQATYDKIERTIMHYARLLRSLPNYRSIHAGGVLISEKPIYHYSALDLPPKDFPTVQWSMLEAEDLGLAKFDILGQRGLGHIKDAIQIVKENQNVDVDIHRIQDFKEDKRIQRLISSGHTMGCFYVESPAMRQLLLKLKCDNYLTLVAASSIIRPGVARSGMMREYTWRHLDPERRKKAHTELMKIMPDTYGIMVYQEDVIKVAHYFAGLGLAESDVLRRGMSGKFRKREEFQQVKQRYFELCREKGHSDELAAEVWFQIESFAGYSFAKGHSASYAVESYQSLYLKAYFPLEFYTAVINNFGGFYRTEFYVHAARMCGANIQAPCVNNSHGATSIKDKTIYLGLAHISSLEQKVIHRIVEERRANGPYTSLYDFSERVNPGLEQLKILLRIGAFRFTGKNRKELTWEAHWLQNRQKPAPVVPKLFREKPREFVLPALTCEEAEDAFEQIELLGFALCNPFDLVKREADSAPTPLTARHVPRCMGKRISMEGYLVDIKPTRTIKGEEMSFGTWIDRNGHFFDTTHFPSATRQYPFRGRGVYLLKGLVSDDFGVCSIEVSYMRKLPYITDPRYE